MVQPATDSSLAGRTHRANPPPRTTLPRTALYLSLGGLLPMALATAAIWSPLVDSTVATAMLVSYCAVILSFMGGVHWGMSLRLSGSVQSRSLIASVLPPVYGWVASTAGASSGLVLMVAGFAGVYWLDVVAARHDRFPGWYLRLRRNMTASVVGCLSIALGALPGA